MDVPFYSGTLTELLVTNISFYKLGDIMTLMHQFLLIMLHDGMMLLRDTQISILYMTTLDANDHRVRYKFYG